MNEKIQRALEESGIIDEVVKQTREQLGEVVFDEAGENQLYYQALSLNLAKTLSAFIAQL